MATITAATGNNTDVQNAINSANPAGGDTVIIPNGTWVWPGPVTISKAVTLQGQTFSAPPAQGAGTTSVFIQRSSSYPPAQYYNSSLLNISPSGNPAITVQGIEFDQLLGTTLSNSYYSSILITGVDSGTVPNKVRITNCYFNTGADIIIWRGGCYGLVDHCTFFRTTETILQWGSISNLGDAPWARNDWQAGSLNFPFCEDCTFFLDQIDTFQPWVQYHYAGGRSVLRHCTIDQSTAPNGGTGPVDAHGNQNYWSSTFNNTRSTIRTEWYNNVVKLGGNISIPMDLRGGSHIIHDNTYTTTDGISHGLVSFRDEEDFQSSPGYPFYGNTRSPVQWPCEDQISATFLWNNTVNGVSDNGINLGNGSFDGPYIQQGRDYWLNAPNSTTTTTYPAPTGQSSGSGYPTPYNLPGYQITSYTPAQYPHPLQNVVVDTTPPSVPGGLTASSPNTGEIDLSWTASTDNITPGPNIVYSIERALGSSGTFSQIDTVTGTTAYQSKQLAPGTLYRYRIRANDAAGNFSGYSAIVSKPTGSGIAIPYFVQKSEVDQTATSATSISAPAFSAAQSAGNLNIVALGWHPGATLVTVADTAGNTYNAAGPIVTDIDGTTGVVRAQQIFIAKNILAAAAGSNVVTATHSPASTFLDIRAVEYALLDQTNPLDVIASATGTGTTAAVGPFTTTLSGDLLVCFSYQAGAVQTITSGYTKRNTAVNPLVEDLASGPPGANSASITLVQSTGWVMHGVGLAAIGAGAGPPIGVAGTPVYPTSIDSDTNLGPTLNIIPGVTTLAQGDQLGITKNLINQLIALETMAGITASVVTAAHDYRIRKYPLAVFQAGLEFTPSAAAYARFGTQNRRPHLAFTQSAVNGACFFGVIPQTALLSSGLLVRLKWKSISATIGSCLWGVQFSRLNTAESFDSYDVQATGLSACSGTMSVLVEVAIPISAIDGLTPGDGFQLLVQRVGTNPSDTLVGDACLRLIVIESP